MPENAFLKRSFLENSSQGQIAESRYRPQWAAPALFLFYYILFMVIF